MPALSGELLPAGAALHLRGPDPDPQRDPVEELVQRWLIGYPSKNSRDAFGVDIREWTSFCTASGIDARSARRFHVEAWMRALEQDPRELAPATLARKIAAVSSFYTWAIGNEYADRNPTVGVKRPKPQVDPTRHGGLTLDQLRHLLAAADTDDHRQAPRERFALRLMALNGLRVGSLVGANTGDLGQVHGHPGITVPVKGARKQFTPFAPSTLAARDAYLEHLQRAPWIRAGVIVHRDQARGPAKSPLFTLYETGARATASSFTCALTRLARLADLPADVAERITPHWLRHTFVTLSLAAGVELHHVQDGAGHSNPAITRGYDGNRNSVENHATYRLDSVVTGP
jgi:site-specific recombinase XerD